MINFVEQLFNVYIKTFYTYYHVKEVRDLELIAFTNGILYILTSLEINPAKVTIKNGTLKDSLDEVLNKFKSSNLDVSNGEKIDDFINDTDNVGIRKYALSGTRPTSD